MLFGIVFGAVTVYVGLRAGPDRRRLHPHLGAVDQPAARPRQGHDPREQHRPDHGLGRRVGGGRGDLHPARPHLPGLPPRVHAHLPARPHRRLAGRAVHDPAPPPAHRGRARQPALPRGQPPAPTCSWPARRAAPSRAGSSTASASAASTPSSRTRTRSRSSTPRRTTARPGCRGRRLRAAITSEYLGVGYIIGPKIAGVIFAGGVFSWLVMMPAIKFFGSHGADAHLPEHHPDRADDVRRPLALLHPLHRRGCGGRGRPHHPRCAPCPRSWPRLRAGAADLKKSGGGRSRRSRSARAATCRCPSFSAARP